jgi:hypothetical protein
VVVLTGAGTTSISGTYPSFTITSNDQYVGTVTSVGLTMPAAFSVANSPVTTSGTLAVTAIGLSSQYIRGDGQLANFPTPGGGGSSVNYYLNGSVNQGTFGGVIYYELSKTPIAGAGTNFTRTSASGNGYVASFITDANDPDQINIPGGNFNLEFYFNSSSNGGSPAFYGELYKVSTSNVFTLIASGSANSEVITGGTSVDQYYTSIAVPQTALLSTDRLAIRVYVIVDGRNITLHTENSNFSEVITTFSTGLNSLNGLSDQVQYFAVGTSGTDFAISSSVDTHTFNLPTASATNRGALSSADWSTFSGKQNALTLTTTGTTGAATLIGATLNIPNYADQFVGTVTSVDLTAGTGITVSGGPITSSGSITVNNSDRGSSQNIFKNIAVAGQSTIVADLNDDTLTIVAGTGVTITTNDTTDTLTISAAGSGGTITGTGTTNYVSKFTSSSAIGNSAIYDNAGNIGIGTTSPGTKLDVVGNARMGANTSQQAFAALQVSAGEGTTTTYRDIDLHGFWAAGEGHAITANYGTTTSDIVGQIVFQHDNPGSKIKFGRLYDSGNQSTYPMELVSDGGSANLTITGKVGIGTTNPTSKLYIEGGSANWNETTPGLSVGTIHLDPGVSTNDFGNAITFGASDASSGTDAQAGIYVRSDGAYGTKMYFATTDAYVTGSKTRMYISEAGSVGIGNTAPSQILHVTGNLRVTGAYYDSGNSAGTSGQILSSTATGTSWIAAPSGSISGSGTTNYVPKFTGASAIGDSAIYDNSGKIGIGTTAASAKFQVVSGIQSNTVSVANSAAYIYGIDVGLAIGQDNGAGGYGTWVQSTRLSDGVSFSMALNPNGGNVGIGTIAPQALLHVSGTVSYGSARFSPTSADGESAIAFYADVAGTSTSTSWVVGQAGWGHTGDFVIGNENGGAGGNVRLLIERSGNVGIGTTGPASKLHVQDGDIRIYNSTSANPTIYFGNYNVSTAYPQVSIVQSDAGSYGGNLEFYTKPNGGPTNALIFAMNITHQQRVGIGTTAPSFKTTISADITKDGDLSPGTAQLSLEGITTPGKRMILGYDTNSNGFGFIKAGNFGVTWTTLSLQPDGGNVGIGTTSPAAKLHVAGTQYISGDLRIGSSFGATNQTSIFKDQGSAGLGIFTWGDTAPVVIGGGHVIIRSESGANRNLYVTGNVGIGTTGPSYKLDVVGDARITSGSLGVGVAPNATDGRIDASNDIVAFQTSDRRLKENITPITNALEKVRSLTGVMFDWKEETKSVHGYEGHDVGIIAQDVQAVLPEAVRTNDTGYLSVRYEKMIALLIEANKELATRVEELESKLK